LEINTFLNILFAKKIIVPSENTARDLIRFYKTDLRRIKVINHGIEKIAKNIKSGDNRGEYNILFIGRLEKRKNIAGIIGAFEKFMDEVKISKVPPANNIKINLILAGKAGFGFEEIERKISGSSYKKNIILPGYVSEKEKRKLYSDADVFIFPSLYEGFGIPILEAMRYGVPVITSNSSSLWEIAGDSALPVDPFDAEEISAALMKIFQDKSLREKMIEKGYENLERFSWEKCAEETLEVLTGWK
jgi:glycosyltransferase involved in cell wall biosynthesis